MSQCPGALRGLAVALSAGKGLPVARGQTDGGDGRTRELVAEPSTAATGCDTEPLPQGLAEERLSVPR